MRVSKTVEHVTQSALNLCIRAGTPFAMEEAMRRSRKNDPTDERQMPEAPLGAPQAAGDTTAAVPDRDRVAMRAYERYLSRGGADGQAMDDWLEAERECASEGTDRGSE